MTKNDFLQLQKLQRNSGLSLMEYLQDIGLSYSTYNYWKRKFHSVDSDEQDIPFAQVSLLPSVGPDFDSFLPVFL